MTTKTVSTLIAGVTAQLRAVGIEDPAINARLLIREAFGWSATDQLANLLESAPIDQLPLLESLVERRINREPLSYITGKTEFFKRQFSVDKRVLIPRPESEQLVIQAINYVRKYGIEHPRIADVGTGSGAIAISIALEMPSAEVFATDISPEALKVASMNADQLGAEVGFIQGNLLGSLQGKFDIIVSNPPYIQSHKIKSLEPEIGREPLIALDGGTDGTKVIVPLLKEIQKMLKPSYSAAYVEIDPPIADIVLKTAKARFSYAEVSLLTDLLGLVRSVSIENN
ncbi:MAG: peptide chain release factor N(5)-glutamine methyltransferase [Chloroflexota bacterium]|nr:peptide chain release factor N(5)-glutamine methyltransferase [Chloroflexota bacterium]MQG36956.1 peptide chain release factor N(5)-glutamine methyltransferase [SAR202 cluster bacterium]|tara:strand:+ start:11657 stop:12511 length:855 start_codon:yes stop_codon:yes gene_type:complete